MGPPFAPPLMAGPDGQGTPSKPAAARANVPFAKRLRTKEPKPPFQQEPGRTGEIARLARPSEVETDPTHLLASRRPCRLSPASVLEPGALLAQAQLQEQAPVLSSSVQCRPGQDERGWWAAPCPQRATAAALGTLYKATRAHTPSMSALMENAISDSACIKANLFGFSVVLANDR